MFRLGALSEAPGSPPGRAYAAVFHSAFSRPQSGKREDVCAHPKPFGASSRVLMTVNPENRAAFGLYRSLGFSATGRSDEEEIELGLTLD